MAKKRTRQQKAKTQQKRGRVPAPAVAVVQERQVVVKKPAQMAIPPERRQSLLRVDRAYLTADIRRSLLISTVLCAVLIGIFWLVRYNGSMARQPQFDSGFDSGTLQTGTSL